MADGSNILDTRLKGRRSSCLELSRRISAMVLDAAVHRNEGGTRCCRSGQGQTTGREKGGEVYAPKEMSLASVSLPWSQAKQS